MNYSCKLGNSSTASGSSDRGVCRQVLLVRPRRFYFVVHSASFHGLSALFVFLCIFVVYFYIFCSHGPMLGTALVHHHFHTFSVTIMKK